MIETDRAYFELGATRRRLPGADLVWIDGLADLPAAGVAHRVVPHEAGDPAAWVAELTSAQIEAGFTRGRIYLDEPFEPLEAHLAADGWTLRREPGWVALEPLPSRGTTVDVVPVLGDDGWAAKESIHGADGARPDGYDASASRWVAMERRRVETGELEAWLIVRDGIACGAVCSMTADGVLRAKNLVVHPDHRRTGVGVGVLRRLDAVARDRGLVLGLFSVADTVGSLLYAAAGMRAIVQQHEWSKALDSGE